MMNLDLESLSLRSGEHFEGVYAVDVAPVMLGGTRYDVLIPDGVDIVVDRLAGGYLVNLLAEVNLYGPCARCLSEAVLVVKAEQQEFAPTAKGGWEETELSPFIRDLVVDLHALVREAVVLALPPQIVCRPECEGLCPQCGRDLNKIRCDCSHDQIDGRWSKLKELTFNDADDS